MSLQEWTEVRRQHGDVYITVFPDGLTVPWKPLSIGDYIAYDAQITRLVFPPACLEDEIFKKCVQEQSFIDGMDQLNAGIVTTVVHNIWEYSGPDTPQKLEEDFNMARAIVKESRAAVLHQCAYMIATAFSYTLEQVYTLDYETFLLRLAQAEAKMLTMNMIREPLTINVGASKAVKFGNLNPEEKPRIKVDAKEAWERQQSIRMKGQAQPQATQDKQGRWWEVSPVIESQKRRPINFNAEKQAAEEMILDNHERNEKGAMRQHIIEQKLAGPRAKMIEDAKIIYKDLLQALQSSKK